MFTFAICYRRSVCLSVVCLSVTVVSPTQPVEIFGNFSSVIVSGEPLSPSRILNARGVAKNSDF